MRGVRGIRLASRGHSLLELSITLGITAVILLTLYGFLMTQAMVSLEENSELSKQNSIRTGAQQMIDELEMCRPKRLDSMGAWFEYYLPKPGANGGYELDATGNLIFGVMDSGGTWYPNGFYCVTFIRSNEPEDYLSEKDLHIDAADSGTDLNGNGTTTDIFIGGTLAVTSFDVNGNPIGSTRNLSGKFFMQLDPSIPTGTANAMAFNPPTNFSNVDSANMSSYPIVGTGDPEVAAGLNLNRLHYKGPGIFLIRQVNGINAQHADPIVDTNGNGILDAGENYYDTNGNGFYDEADSEPFTDSNGNNIKDPLESYVDSNNNGKYDCRMTLNFITFKTGQKITDTGLDRDKSVQLQFSKTKIRFKNL